MRKINIILGIVFLGISCGTRTASNVEPNETTELEINEADVGYDISTDAKPYEATWLEISETDKGYVVYNYSGRWDDGKTIAPTSITIRNDSLIWADCFEPAARLSLKKVKIEERKNGSYFFPVGNQFLFKWYDKNKHIAQWTIYLESRPLSSYLYIDSRYNTFPIIDYEWEDNDMED